MKDEVIGVQDQTIEVKGGEFELRRVRWYHKLWRKIFGEPPEPEGVLVASVQLQFSLYADRKGNIKSTVSPPEMIKPISREWKS